MVVIGRNGNVTNPPGQPDVTTRRYVPPMSCVDLSDQHRAVLAALASRQPVPEAMEDVLAELVSWGWVMPSGVVLMGRQMLFGIR